MMKLSQGYSFKNRCTCNKRMFFVVHFKFNLKHREYYMLQIQSQYRLHSAPLIVKYNRVDREINPVLELKENLFLNLSAPCLCKWLPPPLSQEEFKVKWDARDVQFINGIVMSTLRRTNSISVTGCFLLSMKEGSVQSKVEGLPGTHC